MSLPTLDDKARATIAEAQDRQIAEDKAFLLGDRAAEREHHDALEALTMALALHLECTVGTAAELILTTEI